VNTTSRRRPFRDAGATVLPRPGGDFSQTTAREPRRLAHDSATERTGEIMYITRVDFEPMTVWLRPVGGGQEWTAKYENVRLVEPGEAGDCP
jgi:hypothetical protein